MYENYKTKNLYKKQSISPSKIYNNKKLTGKNLTIFLIFLTNCKIFMKNISLKISFFL